VIDRSFGICTSFEVLKNLDEIPIWDCLESKGLLLVRAAGNDNIDIDTYHVFPASLPRSNVIAVGTTDATSKAGTIFNSEQGSWAS
jgi:hypothetical protein